MAINGNTLGTVQGRVTGINTTEANQRTGLDDIMIQVNANDENSVKLTGNQTVAGNKNLTGNTSVGGTLEVTGNATLNGAVEAQGRIGELVNATGSQTVTLDQFYTEVRHSGGGTLTIQTNTGTPDGAVVNIYSTAGVTVVWPANSVGITLGSSARIASGWVINTAGAMAYSETVGA